MKVRSIDLGVLLCVSTIFVSSQEENITTLEDKYVSYFGNDPSSPMQWRAAKLWSYETNATRLRKFCASAHALAGKGIINVDVVILRQRVLKFHRPNYHAMQIMVAAYGVTSDKKVGILERDFWYTREPNHWYLTEGLSSNCAYLLDLADVKTGQFYIEGHVCGIDVLIAT